ncbi:sensor histidine kinase [Parablautia muri]|uniref:histidine kinase n=1 Tax=Parablautia muri TaxID=2320879 RepID=A0A9X5BGY2_9FIRM|nr:sensor histidine kinase [Parablautia muri]NBJ93725.1 sensor histidine kinase [Parablautia muri]
MAKGRKATQWKKISIRYTIFIYFTVSALVAMLLSGIALYVQLSHQFVAAMQKESQVVLGQVSQSVDSYLRTIMKLSDSLYYGIIKNADLSEESINSRITLLYDNNKDSIANIALLSKEGELLEAVPAARLKTGLDVTKEEWFENTLARTDNLHFSTPRVQYIFDNNENQYRWVITLTRAVEITHGTSTEQGILLMDIRYSSLQQILENIVLGNEGYLYMVNGGGELIYHPKMQLIETGWMAENIAAAAGYRDGSYQEEYEGEMRSVNVKIVGYTGWKLLSVTPEKGLSLSNLKMRLFVAFVVASFLLALILINAFISSRITDPIQELEKTVNAIEAGELDTEVYTGGSYEIQHLGRSIGEMAKRIKTLMQDIVTEHESKRKSEFDTLQSQINPHFLYNTLDIIVWMIENEQKQEAVKVVTALARFFRISLSKGKSIIPVRDELEHVRNYLMIQQMRFKNKFTYVIEAKEDVMGLACLKLLLQPLVENAIYHGMEFMDGDGEIRVEAYRQEDSLWFKISDNGLGMTKEQAESLLNETPKVRSGKGSGIGVKNVNERIGLYFGKPYGLFIESEPDEGTVIRIHLPAEIYTEMIGTGPQT